MTTANVQADRAALTTRSVGDRVPIVSSCLSWFFVFWPSIQKLKSTLNGNHRDLCTRTREVLRPIGDIEFLPVAHSYLRVLSHSMYSV